MQSSIWLCEVLRENAVLLRALAQAQQRIHQMEMALAASQAQHLAAERERMHVHERLMRHESLIAWLREDMRRLAGEAFDQGAGEPSPAPEDLRLAEQVICQTGCVSHNYHWREGNHCKRNDQACHVSLATSSPQENSNE